MLKLKSSGLHTTTGVVSAIAASLCCIAPAITIIAGGTSMLGNFAWIEPIRPYLIGISTIALAYAWYLKLKPVKVNQADCCASPGKKSFFQSKSFLGLVTIFAIAAMTFPLYVNKLVAKSPVVPVGDSAGTSKQQAIFSVSGMDCEGCESIINKRLSSLKGVFAFETSYDAASSAVIFDSLHIKAVDIGEAIKEAGFEVKGYHISDHIADNISFYSTPLTCAAAPTIGCGSRAKFILLEIQKQKEFVERAWLNRQGTVVAIKWFNNTDEKKKVAIVEKIKVQHNITLQQIDTSKAITPEISFARNSNWFTAATIDQLSIEEAEIIAEKTISGYRQKGLINPVFEKKFQTDIANIYGNLFLSISSYSELTREAYDKVEEAIQRAGEKYVGKGKMPRVELCVSTNVTCNKDESCSKDASKSCCEKK